MTKLTKFFIVLKWVVFTFLFYASHCDSQNLKLSVKIEKLNLWINLMPGGPVSLHAACEMLLKNNGSFTFKNLQITDVSIFQSNQKLYSFTPLVLFDDKVIESINLNGSEAQKFIFTTKHGLTINKNQDENSPVDVLITFKNYNGDELNYKIDKALIQKVY